MDTRTLLAGALIALSTSLHAQTGDQQRGSVPLGRSQDGSGPSDGAIKGGSILPGERGGMPDPGADRRISPEERHKRCMELGGVLREECLTNERNATSGGTAPGSQPGVPPLTTPPPQNPR
jgi:hypothetical protein